MVNFLGTIEIANLHRSSALAREIFALHPRRRAFNLETFDTTLSIGQSELSVDHETDQPIDLTMICKTIRQIFTRLASCRLFR
jgi:hypothetical protein